MTVLSQTRRHSRRPAGAWEAVLRPYKTTGPPAGSRNGHLGAMVCPASESIGGPAITARTGDFDRILRLMRVGGELGRGSWQAAPQPRLGRCRLACPTAEDRPHFAHTGAMRAEPAQISCCMSRLCRLWHGLVSPTPTHTRPAVHPSSLIEDDHAAGVITSTTGRREWDRPGQLQPTEARLQAKARAKARARAKRQRLQPRSGSD